MQALRMTKDISPDGYLHVRIPRGFIAKRVELIILPAQEQPEVCGDQEVKESEIEWDADYDATDSSTCQTWRNFEQMDRECGPEDMKQWK